MRGFPDLEIPGPPGRTIHIRTTTPVRRCTSDDALRHSRIDPEEARGLAKAKGGCTKSTIERARYSRFPTLPSFPSPDNAKPLHLWRFRGIKSATHVESCSTEVARCSLKGGEKLEVVGGKPRPFKAASLYKVTCPADRRPQIFTGNCQYFQILQGSHPSLQAWQIFYCPIGYSKDSSQDRMTDVDRAVCMVTAGFLTRGSHVEH